MAPPSDALRLTDAVSRREWLRLGGLGCLGISLSDLLKVHAGGNSTSTASPSFGRAKSCLLIFLVGGPPQHETFDPKPGAPPEIRGPFSSIRTSIPGVHFSELLPHTARIADRITVVRSMTTDINAHSTSGHYMLTGNPHPSGQAESPASSDDWPSLAALVGALKPSTRGPFSAVVLPEPIINNPNILWPGQNAGMMGAVHHPHLFRCDPSSPDFEVDGLKRPRDVSELRLTERQSLLSQLDHHFIAEAKCDAINGVDRMQQQAFAVIRSTATLAAFELDRETGTLRDRYGRHKFGQSLLLARRLIEAGTRLVQVNWPREPGDTTSANPVWDTHVKNDERCRDTLCPQFDRAFATLIDDLSLRGLLDETLVVVMGEFGRSPKINEQGGRDHWGHVFSVAMAGAGTRPGQVIGESDREAGYPIHRPVRPSELAATILHLLGITPDAEFSDVLGRPRRATDGGVPMPELIA